MFPFRASLFCSTSNAGGGGAGDPVDLGCHDNVSTYSAVKNRVHLIAITPPQNCDISTISFISGPAASSTYRAVVFSDNAGVADILLAQSTNRSGVSANTTYDVDLTSPLSLSAGTKYWIGFHWGNASSPIVVGNSPGTHSARISNSDAYDDGTASPYVGNTTNPGVDWTFWATGIVT